MVGTHYICFLPKKVWVDALYISFAEPAAYLNRAGEPTLPKPDPGTSIILIVRAHDRGREILAIGRDVTHDRDTFQRYYLQYCAGKWDAFECYFIDEDVLNTALNIL